jgi:Fic family protein
MYKPNFKITPKINNWIAQIEAMKKKFELSRILPEQEIVLRYRAAIESINSSTSIEGNPLNKKQVESALAGKMNSWEKKVIEVVNYKKAWDWIEKRNKNKSNILFKDVLKLHSLVANNLLSEDKTGHIRPSNIYIVDSRGNVNYIGPKSSQVKKLIEGLFDWLNEQKDKLHPVLIAGILHYEFVSIHPFSDGNGRTTRLLVKMFLNLFNYDFRGCLVLDSYYWQNLSAYYGAISHAKIYKDQSKADITDWLKYFTEGFYRETKELERKVEILNLGRNTGIIKLSDDEIQILDYVKQFGQIDLEEALDVLQIPTRTCQRRLNVLVNKKILKMVEKSKNTYYIFKNYKL